VSPAGSSGGPASSPSAASGPARGALRLAGQATALLGLRWTLWWRRLFHDHRRGTLLLIVPGLLLGLFTSLSVGGLLPGWLGQLEPGLRAVGGVGGPVVLGTFFLSAGLLLRLYFALLAALTGTPFLEPRRLLHWAVPPALVSALNLAAHLLEPEWLVFYPPAAGLAVGLSHMEGGPAFAALLPSFALCFAASGAVLQLLQAVVRAILDRRRLRRAAFALFLVSLFLFLRDPSPPASPHVDRPLSVLLWPLLARSPAGQAMRLAGALTRGALLDALAPVAQLLLLFGGCALLAHRISLAEARRPAESLGPGRSGPAPAGWSLPLLPGPVSALIEKEARSLGRAGWQQLVAAPVALLLLRLGLAAPAAPQLLGPQPILFCAAYAHLGVLGYTVNLFGWDHDAVRGYFLWPVRPRTVLAAKNAVAYAASLALFLLQAGMLRTFGPVTPGQLLVGLLAHAATFPLLAAVGNTMSILWPVPVRSARLRLTASATTGLLRLAALLLLAGAGLAPWLVAQASGLPLLAAYGGELAAMGAVYGGLLAAGESLLERRRERLLQVLARDD
jgi:hypothetical protein